MILLNDNDLFRQMICEYMLRRYDELENDRQQILSNISFHRLDSEKYYVLIVNDIRQDTIRSVFRSIRIIMDDYLK